MENSELFAVTPIGIRVTTENWVWIAYIDNNGDIQEACLGQNVERPEVNKPIALRKRQYKGKEYTFAYSN